MRQRWFEARLKAIVVAVTCSATLLAVAATPAGAHQTSKTARAARNHHRRVLAETFMQPQTGGSLSTSTGVAISVPPGVMERAGHVTITSLGRGVYDIHIDAPWHGSVTVTIPLRSSSDYVLHKVGDIWLNESLTRGQSTVTVAQLSSFLSSIGNFVNKVAGKLCLTTNLVSLVECAAGHIDSKLKSWIESKLPHDCAIQLAEGGNPLAIAKAAVSGDCVGQAGETGFTVPATPSPPTPGPSAPATTSPSTPATGSVPTSPSAPPPPPPPPPPPSRSIQIGWSGSHSGWIWMTLTGFSTGAHQYTCSFASGGDATYTLTETASPETWDNGHTCYDFEHGDTVWVVVEGVSSNSIGVP